MCFNGTICTKSKDVPTLHAKGKTAKKKANGSWQRQLTNRMAKRHR